MLQKTYITLLFLLVASSAFAQKTERDYLRSGNKLYNDSLFIKAEVDYRKALEINLKSTDAMFNLGNSLLMQQKAKEAPCLRAASQSPRRMGSERKTIL